MSGPPARPLSTPARTALALALAAYLASDVWLSWRTSVLEPYSDMFAWMDRWFHWQADHDLWAFLWAPHNFHHLVITFAVLALDIRAFGASGYLFLAVGVASLAATGAMLAAWGAAGAGRGLRLVGGGVAAAIGLMGCHVLDATDNITGTYVHALAFAVAAILLAEGPRATTLRRGGALACAVLSGLGNAAGLAVWPALLFGAWRRRDWRWAAMVLVAGGAFSLAYFVGDRTSAGPGGAGLAAQLGDAVLLVLNYLGLPWMRAAPELGWLMGLAVLAVSLAALVSGGRRGADWPQRAAGPAIVFSLMTALMAGAGRSGLIAPELTPMRYAVFMVPLQAGLWVLALPWLGRLSSRRPRAAEGLAVAAAALLILHQAAMALFAVRTGDGNLALLADYRAGRDTPQVRQLIAPDLAQAHALSARMQALGLYQRELRADPKP